MNQRYLKKFGKRQKGNKRGDRSKNVEHFNRNLDAELRQLYQHVLDEPVPDELRKIVVDLKGKPDDDKPSNQ